MKIVTSDATTLILSEHVDDSGWKWDVVVSTEKFSNVKIYIKIGVKDSKGCYIHESRGYDDENVKASEITAGIGLGLGVPIPQEIYEELRSFLATLEW